MFSIEVRRSDCVCAAFATLILIFTASTSLGFSTRAEAQTGTVHEHPSELSSSVEVAVAVAVFGAYGWVADKYYDLGKEVGKRKALEEAQSKEGGVGGRLLLDHRYEMLLD